MCGLVGIAGDLRMRDEALMKRLLIFDYFRGTDSTGIAAVRSNGQTCEIAKIASHPIDLFDSKKFGTVLNGNQSKAFIGHNRAATLGKVNGHNAHPYQFDHITGTHNGTLDQASWDRLVKAAGGEPTGTDSAAIFQCIAAIGIEETVALMEEGNTASKGAWALVWHNAEDETINFLRNQHRPLWFAWSEDLRRLFWASESDFIRAALHTGKNPEDVWADKDNNGYWSFGTDFLYTLKLADIAEANKKNKPKFKGKQLKGREPAPVQTYSGQGNAPFHGGTTATGTNTGGGNTTQTNQTTTMGTPPANGDGKQSGTHSSTTTGSTTSAERQSTDRKVIDMIAWKGEPTARVVTKERFDQLAEHGCSWCSADIDYEDGGYSIYELDEAILCSECTGCNDDDAVKVYMTMSAMNSLM